MADEKALTRSILVVGGGISGLTTAVEAAEAGREVFIVEKRPYLGGRVAQLNQYFPKLCPPSCGLEINFRRIRQNPRIRTFTMAEVENISGEEGNFDVTIKLNPRYVNENCTACGECAAGVTIEIPNEYNYDMNKIKAVYLPHDMAYPMRLAMSHVICQSSLAWPGGATALRTRCTRLSVLEKVPSFSAKQADGSTTSAILAVSVIKRSCTTRKSSLERLFSA